MKRQEVFLITHRCKKQEIHLYPVKDLLDEHIDGHFYEQELQVVAKDIYFIYKIEKKRWNKIAFCEVVRLASKIL